LTARRISTSSLSQASQEYCSASTRPSSPPARSRDANFFSLLPAGLGAAVSLRGGAHCSQQIRRRAPRSRRQPQHAASRRSRPSDLCTELRFRVERHGIRVASTPRGNRHRRIVDARTDISRVNRIELFPSMVSLQSIAAFFLDAGSARRGTATNERATAHGRAKSLAPQYVMPRTTGTRVRRLKTKKIFNR
jgi:hypothetical protein